MQEAANDALALTLLSFSLPKVYFLWLKVFFLSISCNSVKGGRVVLDMDTSHEAGVGALSLSSYYLVNDGLQHEVGEFVKA
jgi:hypothetical protein